MQHVRILHWHHRKVFGKLSCYLPHLTNAQKAVGHILPFPRLGISNIPHHDVSGRIL